jgi:hypothetical protein
VLDENDPVATWPDEVGSNDLEQATGANQPLFREAGFNGHPGVEFVAASQHFMDAAGINLAQPVTYVFICQTSKGTTGVAKFMDGIDAGARHTTMLDGTSWRMFAGGTTVTLGSGFNANTPMLIETWFAQNNPNSGTAVDNVNIGTSNSVGTNDIDGFRLARHRTATNEFMPMIVAELIIYDRVLTTQEKADLFDYYETTYLAADVEVDLAGVLPALAGAFTVDATVTADLDGQLPALTGDYTIHVTTDVDVDLAGTLPALQGAFTVAVTQDVDVDLAGVLPTLTGAFQVRVGVEPVGRPIQPMAALRPIQPMFTGVP